MELAIPKKIATGTNNFLSKTSAMPRLCHSLPYSIILKGVISLSRILLRGRGGGATKLSVGNL